MKMKRFLDNPYRVFSVLAHRRLFDWLPDKAFLKLQFRAQMGMHLNLRNPQTFNEKLQWLKLYDRKPEYTMMVDKLQVRDYIAERIGEEYLIPLLGVWEDPDDIDFDALPDQFVLKCTHNSGLGMCICKDKSKLDIVKVKRELRRGLKQNYYLTGREWPYKDVQPRIIAEAYMEDEATGELRDYKFMCFDGVAKCSFVCSGRHSNEGLNVTFVDRECNVMPFERHYPALKTIALNPELYGKMLALAEELSDGFLFVRVDFYEVNGSIYFGELTFFPGSGYEEFTPEEWDYTLGSWIRLPNKTRD